MEAGPAQEKPRATVEGVKRLTKDKTIKIRMDATELLELDRIGNLLGFAERATTLRWLMTYYNEMARARQVLAAFDNYVEADRALRSLLGVKKD